MNSKLPADLQPEVSNGAKVYYYRHITDEPRTARAQKGIKITMRCKTLTAAAAVLLMLTAGCSTLERVVYRPDINQGNYLAPNDVAKIRVGMTQQQVAYALGTPMMTDPFGTNTWFYVFRQEPGHQKVTQQTLTLTFNSGGVLTNIDNKPALTSQ